MGDPEAETHRWVVVAPYTSTHPLPPGYTHLQASTGDIIVPSGQTEVSITWAFLFPAILIFSLSHVYL